MDRDKYPIAHVAKCLDPPEGCGQYTRRLPDRTCVIFHDAGCPAEAARETEAAVAVLRAHLAGDHELCDHLPGWEQALLDAPRQRPLWKDRHWQLVLRSPKGGMITIGVVAGTGTEASRSALELFPGAKVEAVVELAAPGDRRDEDAMMFSATGVLITGGLS